MLYLIGYFKVRAKSFQDAEDLAQECLIWVVDNLEQYNPKYSLYTFIFRYKAKNMLKDYWRKHYTKVPGTNNQPSGKENDNNEFVQKEVTFSESGINDVDSWRLDETIKYELCRTYDRQQNCRFGRNSHGAKQQYIRRFPRANAVDR